MRLSIYDFSYESLEAREPVFSSVDKWDKPYRFRCSAVLLKIIDENRIRRRDALVTAYMHPESRIRLCEMDQMGCIKRIEVHKGSGRHFPDICPVRCECIRSHNHSIPVTPEIVTEPEDVLIGHRMEENSALEQAAGIFSFDANPAVDYEEEAFRRRMKRKKKPQKRKSRGI